MGPFSGQRGKAPVIRVGKAGDAAREDNAHIGLDPGGRDTPTRQHARVGHARRDGGRAEIHRLEQQVDELLGHRR
ncbi:MAG: hypothetical protein ACYDDU_00585 [Dermatophilaceae bacterium]